MPVPPGSRGSRLFLTSVTDDMMQQHREQLFAVEKKSIMDAAHRYGCMVEYIPFPESLR